MLKIMKNEVENNKNNLPITKMCDILGISRSYYYQYKDKVDSNTDYEFRNKELIDKIIDIKNRIPFYGYRRIVYALNEEGYFVNHKKVSKIIHIKGLINKRKKRKIFTTDSNHNRGVFPNIAKVEKVTNINQLWVSDITYIPYQDDFVYLAVILDVYSRRCIGWALSSSMSKGLVLRALKNAISSRRCNFSNIIHHSDRGSQYCSESYITLLKSHGFKISMSRKGNPYDNAICERFIGTIKREEIDLKDYKSGSDLLGSIRAYVDDFYNNHRFHSSLDYLSPIDFENNLLNTDNDISILEDVICNSLN